MTPALIRTLEWDTDKVRCTICRMPWAMHDYDEDIRDYVCHEFQGPRVLWWVKEEIRR